MTGAALVLDGLDVRAGDIDILHQVDLVVPSGTVTTVVGASGAGKTTLLRAIAGLAPVTAGRICIAGDDVTHTPSAQRDVAVVFQEPRLFPNLDVADNVSFALRVQGMSSTARRARAAELLDAVGLGGFDTRRVRQLSGGEQQRVNLARALAAEPALLLLDEPLAAVDPGRRADLRDLLRRVHMDFETTAVHVTHDLDEAAELGDRLAVVRDGTIVQHAVVTDVFRTPVDPDVAALTGNPNVLIGEVRAGLAHVPGGTLPAAGPDSAAMVTVRPEHLHEHTDGTLAGVVTDVRYRGSHTAVHVDLGGTTVLWTSTSRSPDVGDHVRLGADHADIHRYPDRRTAQAAAHVEEP